MSNQRNQPPSHHANSYSPYARKPLPSRVAVAVTTVLQQYHMAGISWRYNKMLQGGLAELLSEIQEVTQNFQSLVSQIGAPNLSTPSLLDAGMDASALSLHLYLSPSGQDLLTTSTQPMDTSLDFSTSSLPTTSLPTTSSFPTTPLSPTETPDITMGEAADSHPTKAEIHVIKAAEKLLDLVALLIGTPSTKRYNRFHTDASELVELIPVLYSMFKGGRSLGVIYDYARRGWVLGATTAVGVPSAASQLVIDALRKIILRHNLLTGKQLSEQQPTRMIEPC